MTEKTLEFKFDNCCITVINGENVICEKQSCNVTEGFIENSGYYNVNIEPFDITLDIDLQTKIIIEPLELCEITAIPQLVFTSQYINYTTKYENFTLNDNAYELTTNFSNYNSFYTKSISFSIQTKRNYSTLKLDLTNCACNVNEGKILAENNITIRVTCGNNYEFDNNPELGDSGLTTGYITTLDEWGNTTTKLTHDTNFYTFEKIDNCTYELTFSPIKNITYQLVAKAALNSNVAEKFGLISAYRLNRQELREIAKKRFVKPTISSTTTDGYIVIYNYTEDYIDTAKYVVSLIKINVPIITTQKDKLFFGPHNINIDCDIIDTDIITLNFGSIKINGLYNNSIDFEHTNIQIYLPYIGFVDLNTADYMNKTLSLTYQVNILNGDSLAILYANGNVIQTISCNVAVKIPYKMMDNELVQTPLDPNTNYLNETNPFIYIKTSKAVSNDILPYHDTKFYAILGTLSGYTEATEIALAIQNDFITKSEIEEIKSLISQGIII